ncbi:histone acetyltransferase subunit NuA4-domain-containing protein [Aspergillus cavernicola]|uniref:Chromatin modification-related protein EAF6 n=1 Tax=Aspergillus cavernicola TaxID=176166 RepID=A0ABR4IPP1_9EURO
MAESATATPSAPIAVPAATPASPGPSTPATADPTASSSSQPQPGNVPANTNTKTNTTTNEPNPQDQRNRGLPYYEKLRRELRDTLQKKRLMDKSMAQLEDQIYRFEQSYLEETTAGNIIKGFDTYIKGSSTGSGLSVGMSLTSSGVGTASRRKPAVTDNDRVFSRSSAAFMRDSPAPSSAQTTPSHAPTPTSMYNGSTGKPSNGNGNGNGDTSSAPGSVKGSSSSSKNKKKNNNNNKGDEDDDDKPPSKRLKISYGRD